MVSQPGSILDSAEGFLRWRKVRPSLCRLSNTFSTAFYLLSGTITINEPDEVNGMPCRHIITQTLSESYVDDAFDVGYEMTVSKKLGLARFAIASLMLPGYTLSTNETGCNAGPPQSITVNGPSGELYGLAVKLDVRESTRR